MLEIFLIKVDLEISTLWGWIHLRFNLQKRLIKNDPSTPKQFSSLGIYQFQNEYVPLEILQRH